MRLLRLLALPLLAAGALAGCGGDDGGGGADAAERPATTPPAATTTDRAAAPAPPAGEEARPGLRLTKIGDFEAPLYVTAPPGDRRRVFVVEQGGRIRVMQGGRLLERPFLDITGQVTAGGEQGLLSMAFAPDYAKSGRFYVYFTDRDARQRVVEYRASSSESDVADPGSARVVLVMDDPEPNHNGGQLQFGPDGLLYIGTGDGGGGGDQHGSRGNGQDLGSLLGKILRIDPRPRGGRAYAIPSGNPFADRSGARPEIYAYGLRNPWRFSFDRETGDLSIGDVGQDSVEEIDFEREGRAAGRNFGWRVFEGSQRFAEGSAPGAVAPVIEHAHSDGWVSITGGYVVRDPRLADLEGRYVYGDFGLGVLHSARLGAGGARDDRASDLKVEALSSFGEDASGRVYATSLSGPVYRLDPGG